MAQAAQDTYAKLLGQVGLRRFGCGNPHRLLACGSGGSGFEGRTYERDGLQPSGDGSDGIEWMG